MDIKQLRYFLQICKDGSFSKAAKNAYITQQALSKSILSLEEELDVPLFYRGTRGIIVTEYGEYMREQCEAIVRDIDLMAENIKKLSESYYGTVKAGIVPGLVYYLNPDALESFRNCYPSIKLEFNEYPYQVCEDKILTELLDVAVIVGPVDEKKFDAVKLENRKMKAVINSKNKLFQKEKISVEDLKGEKLVTISDKSHDNLIKLCKQSGFTPDIIYSTAASVMLYDLCSKNNYIGFNVDFVADKMFNYPSIRIAPFEHMDYEWSICLITKKGRIKTKPMEVFIDNIMTYFSLNKV